MSDTFCGSYYNKKGYFRKGCFRKILWLLPVAFLAAGAVGCGARDSEDLDNELAYRQLGINQMEEGAYADAVQSFQDALDQSMAQVGELETDICYYKAAAQYCAGDSEEAIDTYTALIDFDKKNADAYYLLGTLRLALGDVDAAVHAYEGAGEQAKNDGTMITHMAENLMDVGLETQASEFLQKVVKLPGEEAEDCRNKGYAYFLLGDYDNARTYLDRAINMEDVEAMVYLAQMLEEQGDTEQATRIYESYIQKNADDTVTLNALGCARMDEGDYEHALGLFQTALEVENPKNEQSLRRNEIISLERLLRFYEAREKMASYITDYPEDEAAKREYEFLQTR